MPDIVARPGEIHDGTLVSQLPRRYVDVNGDQSEYVENVGATFSGSISVGAVTVIDGGDATQGAKADAAASADTGTFSVVAILKRIVAKLSSVVTNTGNIPAQGQALAAGSTPVVLPAAQITTLTPPSVAALATSAKQDTGNTSLGSIDTKLTNPLPVSGTVTADTGLDLTPLATAAKQPGLGTAGTPNADVLSVQGVDDGTPLTTVPPGTVSATATLTNNNDAVTLALDGRRGGVFFWNNWTDVTKFWLLELEVTVDGSYWVGHPAFSLQNSYAWVGSFTPTRLGQQMPAVMFALPSGATSVRVVRGDSGADSSLDVTIIACTDPWPLGQSEGFISVSSPSFGTQIGIVDANGNLVAPLAGPTGGLTVEGVAGMTPLVTTPAGWTALNLTDSAAHDAIVTGPGVVHGLCVNTAGVGSTAKIYDGLDDLGTLLGTLDTTHLGAAFVLDAAFATGLTVVTAGGTPADVTLLYT